MYKHISMFKFIKDLNILNRQQSMRQHCCMSSKVHSVC